MSSDAKKQTDKIPDETGKTYYERTIDALRLIGTGHAAGLLATGAALGAAIEKHVGSVPLLKCAAILFALGVITFSYAYYSNYQAYRVLDTLRRQLAQFESNGTPIPERKGSSGSQFALRSSIGTVCSFVLFHLGMVVSVIALLFA